MESSGDLNEAGMTGHKSREGVVGKDSGDHLNGRLSHLSMQC